MNRKTTAVLLSGLVCPGAGQIYRGMYVKGGCLIAATVGLLGAVAYKTWNAVLDIVLAIPPGEMADSLLPIARRVLESDRGFYDACGAALLLVWSIGIIDAYVFGRE